MSAPTSPATTASKVRRALEVEASSYHLIEIKELDVHLQHEFDLYRAVGLTCPRVFGPLIT